MGRKSKRKAKPIPQACHTAKLPEDSSSSKYDLLKPTEPLRIIDRLSLPAFQIEPSELENSDLQLDFRPRAYFVSGLCYTCSQACSAREFPCTSCRMISYCSAEHRQQHSPAHRQLCSVLTQICSPALALARGLQADEYRRFRLELLGMVQSSLGRKLELCEREILLYPRLCRSCHASDELTACPGCGLEYACRPGHFQGHAEHCEQYRVFARVLQLQREYGFTAPSLPEHCFDTARSKELLPADFDALVKMMYARELGYERIDCGSYAALSQAASPALTALYALQSLDRMKLGELNRKAMKIHVIGAELQFECANLEVWEKLFVHLVPGLRSLRLEFCGPELQVPEDIAAVLRRPRLCAGCRSKGCRIDVVFHCGKLYHQIDCDRPDLVCLFNPGLYRTTGFANQDTWPQTIEKFCDYGVPILVTSYTEIELPRDLARIREFRELQVDQSPQRNPFASLRPERNFVSDDVAPLIYKNYFLSVARGIPAADRRSAAGRSPD